MPEKTVTVNRKARHDYEILETYEAGIVLTGPEVKSVRQGKVSLSEAYARVNKGELWLYNMHIAPYDPVLQRNYDPRQPRKLLMHRREIDRLMGLTQQRGLTLVPLRVYFNERGYAKIELGLAKGKRKMDRRREIMEREMKREVDRALRGRHK
ncbi:MAG: SsrA-binding protein SmpB [Armatimonadetes bacterium]|nr:SsrA-binding protein SmpB [Armatimonadota bacterium]MCX7967424.1 SsrA-binding protein SmpB [Armatimonadota bacterium]MDW8142070.1 SsrA-binding protein SmpB [Armatimonadota bacterium]